MSWTPNTPENFWTFVQIGDKNECWPWMGFKTVRGYGRASWHGQTRGSHRIAFMLTYNRWPALNVCHSCDNPSCCNPEHMFEGSQADNTIDMARKERGTQKLTAVQIAEIRSTTDKKQKELATMYGVSRSLISLIRNYKVRQYI